MEQANNNKRLMLQTASFWRKHFIIFEFDMIFGEEKKEQLHDYMRLECLVLFSFIYLGY